MQFFYHKDCGTEVLTLDSKDLHYLFGVRRMKQGATLTMANLIDSQLYEYKHEQKNTFKLHATRPAPTKPTPRTHILLAMIDPKDIYDILPMLNALNVASLQIFYADFSQRNRKIDIQKAQRILQYSCMQCGRMNLMSLEIHKDLQALLTAFPNAIAIDFDSQTAFENLPKESRHTLATQGIIIGCEGGLSARERDILQSRTNIYALQIPHILTAHLTSIHIASLCV